MFRRLAIVVLVAAGLWLVAAGVQKWFQSRAAARVAHAFMTALKRGDRETIFSLMQPGQRAWMEHKTDEEQAALFQPHVGLDYRIHHVKINGNQAEVRLWVEKEGFVVQPVLHLHRSDATRWKIGRIDNLQPDPRWSDLELKRSQAEGEQLAEEIVEALRAKPGVSIERVPLDRKPR